MSQPLLTDWLQEQMSNGSRWYVKRLSGNDTGVTGSNAGGPYVPKDFLFEILPELNDPHAENPDTSLRLSIDSHAVPARQIRAVWYNNQLRDGTRNEARLTRFGGAKSPLLTPSNTGALTVFSFLPFAKRCNVWICGNPLEEDILEAIVGPVDPGDLVHWPDMLARSAPSKSRADCRLSPEDLPPGWEEAYPTGRELVALAVEMRDDLDESPDDRIVGRRRCEYEIYRSVEDAIELPAVQAGFETVDEFAAAANTVMQRRKARSGRSLEYHLREVLLEEGLKEEHDFSHQPNVETRPDFVFPAINRHGEAEMDDLTLVAVKTTFKDRWRQVTKECPDIPNRYLLTLQEGTSEAQCREIAEAGIQLVVPKALRGAYPEASQGGLVTITDMIEEIRGRGLSTI